MPSHICIQCRKSFDIEDKIRCPFCGFRIVSKARPVFRKRVKVK